MTNKTCSDTDAGHDWERIGVDADVIKYRCKRCPAWTETKLNEKYRVNVDNFVYEIDGEMFAGLPDQRYENDLLKWSISLIFLFVVGIFITILIL